MDWALGWSSISTYRHTYNDHGFIQLGDNFSKWNYMHLSIQGILQFNLFQIPFVGADTCGFSTFFMSLLNETANNSFA
jgi:alpha-glucosidase (family GH31 glycosyl hydrolase)